jgi:hypothetical protein
MTNVLVRYLLLVLAACAVPASTVAQDSRSAIEAQYRGLADAIRSNDVERILSFQAPNFSSMNPTGNTFDYDAMESYIRRMTAAVDSVIRTQNTIRSFEQQDTIAIADICQEFSRIQRMGDGVRHRVDTSVLQRESWILLDGQWKRFRVENVRGMRWFVDGVRVDPSRPYTSGMPAYVPSVDPPTGCGLR